MDAERDQAGAGRERGRGLVVRCPECGRAAGVGVGLRKSGFWADPVRWMPAVLLVLLAGFQLATPLVIPGLVQQTKLPPPSSPFPTAPAYFAGEMSWQDIDRAAEGSPREVELMAPLVDWLGSRGSWDPWDGTDPAAHLMLRDGVIGLSETDSFWGSSEFLRLGLWRPWLSVDEYARSPLATMKFRFSLTNFGWNVTGKPGAFRVASINLGPPAFAFVVVGSGLFLLTRMLRPTRNESTRRGLRERWLLLTVAVVLSMAAVPTSAVYWFGITALPYLPRSEMGAAKETGVTLETLRQLARGPDAAIALAQTISEARKKAGFGRSERSWSGPGRRVAILRVEPRTPVTETTVSFGWPDRFATVTIRDKAKPVGVKETTGRFRVFYVSWYGFMAQTNAGAWPGRSFVASASTEPLALVFVRSLTGWWLFRSLLRSRFCFRSRKRAARGLCVGCGYDLKGLWGRGAATR